MSVLGSWIHKQKRPQTQPGPWGCAFQASSKAQCQKGVALSHRLPVWEDGGAVSTLERRGTCPLSVKPLPLHLPLPSQAIRPWPCPGPMLTHSPNGVSFIQQASLVPPQCARTCAGHAGLRHGEGQEPTLRSPLSSGETATETQM